jgi:hypothetical protein
VLAALLAEIRLAPSADAHECGSRFEIRDLFRVGTIAALWFALDGAAASTRQGGSRRRQLPPVPGDSRSHCPS